MQVETLGLPKNTSNGYINESVQCIVYRHTTNHPNWEAVGCLSGVVVVIAGVFPPMAHALRFRVMARGR